MYSCSVKLIYHVEIMVSVIVNVQGTHNPPSVLRGVNSLFLLFVISQWQEESPEVGSLKSESRQTS